MSLGPTLPLNDTDSATPPTSGSPPPPPYAVLPTLGAVQDLIKSAAPLLCLYIHASWCTTCRQSHPLYADACQRWSGASVQFTSFDCAPEQQASKEAFGLTFVPCWKFYRAGELIATIDGDWTKFEPLLESLVGPPRRTVPLSPAEADTLAAARRSFQKLAVKLGRRDARREARRNGTRSPDEPDTDSDSDSGSDTDSEAEDDAAASNVP